MLQKHNPLTDPEAGRLCETTYQIFQWHRIFAQFSKVETHSLERKEKKIEKLDFFTTVKRHNLLA